MLLPTLPKKPTITPPPNWRLLKIGETTQPGDKQYAHGVWFDATISGYQIKPQSATFYARKTTP